MNDAQPFIDDPYPPCQTKASLSPRSSRSGALRDHCGFYRDVLGGTVVLEENPCMVKLANSWIIMNPGGPPTPDKPDISVVNYEPVRTTSIFMNLRVADLDDCYKKWSERGAEFPDAADPPWRGDPLLYAGPRRLPDRNGPVDRASVWAPGRKTPRGSSR